MSQSRLLGHLARPTGLRSPRVHCARVRPGHPSVAPQSPPTAAALGHGSPLMVPLAVGRRTIRTGFFPEDMDFMDPEAVLLAEREGTRWRYMDDPSLSAPVLERNNVGMGMVVMNRRLGMDLPMINDLYRRLRDLEVNTLKRFVAFTSMDPGPFCVGLELQELLLAAVIARRDGRLPRFSRALLWNHQELAHLMATFYKPLVCQLGGLAAGSGGAFACLPNFSGAHRGSELVVDCCQAGLTPFGGLSFVLGRLKWNVGEFLALTGWPVRGADLVYLGLVKHWMAPEALPFMELTSEKQLEVSETDARCLLEEHSLPLPDGLTDTDSVPRGILPLVQKAFSKPTVPQILEALRGMEASGDPEQAIFAARCRERMSKAEPLALHATLHLVRKARELVNEALINKRDSQTVLVEVLKLELRAQERLLCSKDAVTGIHAGMQRLIGNAVTATWSRKSITDVTEIEVTDVFDGPGELADFAVSPRSEMPLSRHPKMRKYHPDYDPKTGLDHDPEWMAAEARRWDPELFAEERRAAVHNLLGPADPAALGQARYVRSRVH